MTTLSDAEVDAVDFDVEERKAMVEQDFSVNGLPDHLAVIVKQQARRVEKVCRGLLDYDDLVSEAHLYLWRKRDTLGIYWVKDEQSPFTMGRFRTIVYRRMLDAVAKQRAVRNRGLLGDQYYYNQRVIEELLPDIFAASDRTFPTYTDDGSETRSTYSPSEGNGRAASLIDVQQSFNRLDAEDKTFLFRRYYLGWSPKDIAQEYGITESGVSRRNARIIERMIDNLGGGNPWAR